MIGVCKKVVDFDYAYYFEHAFIWEVFFPAISHLNDTVQIVFGGDPQRFLIRVVLLPPYAREDQVDGFIVRQVLPARSDHFLIHLHVLLLRLSFQDHDLLIFVVKVELVCEIWREHVRQLSLTAKNAGPASNLVLVDPPHLLTIVFFRIIELIVEIQ